MSKPTQPHFRKMLRRELWYKYMFFMVKNWAWFEKYTFYNQSFREEIIPILLSYSSPLNLFLSILFSKNLKTNNYFFLVRIFLLGNVICSIMWTKKFFSFERKFFLSPFFLFSLSIKNFFSLYRSKKRTDTFFRKYENQQLFFSKSWLVLFSDFASCGLPIDEIAHLVAI